MSGEDDNNPHSSDAGDITPWLQVHATDPFGSSGTEREKNAYIGKHFIRLDATGKLGDFGYGAKYISLSKGYESLGKKPEGINEDEAGRESWVSWEQGKLKLKTGYSEYWNNVDNDPDESRNTDRLVSITPSYTLHDWPYVGISVSYKQGSRYSSMDPEGEQPYSGPLSEISTSFDVSMEKMNLYLGTSLQKSSNDLGESESSKTISYFIGGSYSPFDSIHITPDFGISEEKQLKGIQEYRFTSTYSSLSLSYSSPKHPYHLSLDAGYDSYKGNDGYSDSHNINTKLALDWDIRSSLKGQNMLSFEITSDAHTDHIDSNSSSDDITAGVVWRWTGY
jgi:hypothetical protein